MQRMQVICTQIMVHLPVVYGEWCMRDLAWHFVVDNTKGGRMLSLREGCSHRELVEMAKEDYNLDKKTEVDVTYSLPAILLQEMGPDCPPIYVTNDRQVQSMVELASNHIIRLCLSSRLGMGGDDKDYDEKCKEDAEEDVKEEADGCDGGDAKVNMDDHAHVFKKYAAEYTDGEDYSVYGKVKEEDSDEDEDKDEDDKDLDVEGKKASFVAHGGRPWIDGISVNKSYVNKEALKSELRLTAIMSKFAFKIEKSDKTLLVARCSVKGCKWMVRAAVKNEANTFWVMKYLKIHTCSVADRIDKRKRFAPRYIAKLFLERVGYIDGVIPEQIKRSMKNTHGIKMGYTTAYRALIFAQEMVRGSAEDGYERLPSYLHKIQLNNPGTVTALELDDENRFKYLFLAFGASIHGFQYLRRVIVVDGTHLTGKYGGVLLVATGQDGNFQIFPLAFGIVDSENDESWEWFFTKLRGCVSDQYPLVIVSDRHNSIKKACETVFPWAHRGICYYHLQNNIITKYKGKHLLYLVKQAAYAYTLHDFNRYMDALREENPDLATYLENADVALWSRVHFLGDRYNVKTSNIAESINSAIKKAKGFPVSFLLDFIREKLGRWFCKRRADALSLTTQFSRGVEYLMAIREHYADMMTAEGIDGWRFYVKGGHRDCIVDLERRTCECGVWQIERIPCSHAISAAPEVELHTSTLVCPSYGRDYLYTAYSRSIFPKNDDIKAPETVRCLPPLIKRPPGRQKKSRWQTWLEIAKTKGKKQRKLHKQYSCSNCKEPGHTLPNCKTKIEDEV